MSITKPIRVLNVIRQSLIGVGDSYVMTLAHKLDKNAVESFNLSFTYRPKVDKLKSMGVQVFYNYCGRGCPSPRWNPWIC